MNFDRFFLLALGVVAASACSSRGGARVPDGGPDLGNPNVPFRSKTRDEKQAYMAAHVEPTMKRLFQKHSAKAYAGFGCETCHGDDMEAVDFRMPSSLYALPEKDTIAEATSYDEDTTKFMMNEVVPAFAKLLAVKAGEPSGVTCFTCHPHD